MFILGLDGLEYSFVEEFDCKNLKQLHYSQIDVPVDSKREIPLTPQVWASFLTGKWMDDYDFAHKPNYYSLNILKFIRRIIPLSLGLGKKIIRFRNKATSVPIDFPELKLSTFLDLIDSGTINAPFYDFDNVIWDLCMQFGKDELSLSGLQDLSKAHYYNMKTKILSLASKLDDNNEIVFAYMLFPDFLQHIEYLHPEEIMKHYLDLDRFVGELKKKINGVLMIVSDHGFNLKTVTHSLKGFYSTNAELDFKPEKITDFHPFFLKSVK